jgi:outer membrane protein
VSDSKRVVICVAFIATGLAHAEDLTLDEAIRLAFKSNRSLQNAALDSAKLQERRASVKTQLLPSARVIALAGAAVSPFDLNITRGALGFDSGGAPLPAADTRLPHAAGAAGLVMVNVTQPLSTMPTIKRDLSLIEIQQKFAEEQTRLERQTLVRDIRRIYYGIQSVQSALVAAQEGVKLAREVVRLTAEYAEKRLALDADSLEAQVHLAQALETVVDFKNQRETLESKLNQKLSRDVLTEFTVPQITESDETTPDAQLDLMDARRLALAQRPEARQAELRLQQARLEIRNAAAAFNPTVAADYAGITLANLGPLLPRGVGVAGVSLQWEPFTWGRKKHELSVRRDEIQQIENRAEEIKGEVTIDVAEQFRRLPLARARLGIARLRRQMVAESLRVSQKRYEEQFSLLRTVLDAQSALEAANAEYQRSLAELWTARADYERALGADQ